MQGMVKISDHEPPKNDMHDDDDATLAGASEPDTDDGASDGPCEPVTTPSPPDSTGVKAAKAFGVGLACIVGIPVVAALATVGGVVYGAGKVLEGVGKGLAAGPEAAFNATDPDEGGQKATQLPKPEPKLKPKPKPKSESRSKSQ